MTAPLVLGADGAPMRPLAREPAYQAASRSHRDLAGWTPPRVSGRTAISEGRETTSARVQDIARNDGWASAALDRQVDAVIGSGWSLAAKPNARSLGISQAEADEFADTVEAEWRDYADDPGFWCDAGRRSTLAGVLALAFRHRVADGEALGVLHWLPRGGPYATSMKIVDPDRLSTPDMRRDDDTMCMGVEMDGNGAAVAYHIRRRHPSDDVLSLNAIKTWERVPRETAWGRPVVVHAFEPRRAGEVRGISPLAPILRKLKQITRYDGAELQAATLNAVLAAFVESVGGATDAEKLVGEVGSDLQDARADHYGDAPVLIDGVQVSYGYPGDKITLTKPGHPNAAFEAFVRSGLRNVASAAGISYEQLTMDWSQVNYSSARGALLEVWRGLTARKDSFASQFMQPWYAAWFEEAVETGRLVLPRGARGFAERRAAWVQAEWIGPGRGWVDPMKEADASIARMDGLISTLEDETAQQGGDWKRNLEQRAREIRYAKDLGIDVGGTVRPVQSRGTTPTEP